MTDIRRLAQRCISLVRRGRRWITGAVLIGVTASFPAQASGVLPPAAWQAYKRAFVAADGRVIDRGNGDISHSEGQGYGMLLALLADDRATFESIWGWTQRNLRRDDGLFGWQWHPNKTPPVPDWNNATDGDLLIAWALVRASQRWKQPQWLETARAMARRIRETSIANTPFGPVILPAQQGFERGGRYTLNPSYWVYPAIDVLASVDDPAFWSQVRSAGLRLLALSRFPIVGGVPPDWIVLHPDARLGLPDDPSRRRFGFEALRIPLYLCWAGITDRDLFTAYLAVWWSDDTPAWVDLANGDRAAYALQRSHRAARSILQRCQGQRVAPTAPQLLVDDVDYYGSTLMLFATLPHPNAKQIP